MTISRDSENKTAKNRTCSQKQLNRAVRTSDFDFKLPSDLIAQHPKEHRDSSRLLIVERLAKRLIHGEFRDLADYLKAGDLLILNNSQVIPARLKGQKEGNGARVEILLTEKTSSNLWWCMLKPGKRIHIETKIQLHDLHGKPTNHWIVIKDKNDTGKYLLQWPDALDVRKILSEIGETPLPPYIERKQMDTFADRELYQTVYAKYEGSVAAPTAGLHFTESFLNKLKAKGIGIAEVTLHVGPGTFQPVESDLIKDHIMHDEWFEISTDTVNAIQKTKQEGHRIVAVGTTSMRVLESTANENGLIRPQNNRTNIFIHPPYNFRIVDALLTNFHLPKSTLLMLISAFADPGDVAGQKLIMQAYAEAIEKRYRFFSYGDAMFLHL